MQQWVDVSDDRGGLTIVNDGKYAYDARGGDIGVSAARSVPYAHHTPARLVEGADYRFLDLGEQRFRLRLVPHDGPCVPSEATRRAAELNMPPLPLRDTYHAGPASMCESFVTLDASTVGHFTLKRAEDTDADVVRIVDSDGVAARARVALAYRRSDIDLDVAPRTIVNVRVHDDGAIVPVDLCEWTAAERPPSQPNPDGRPLPPESLC
jgi:alpha-mannosidase